MSLRGAGWSRCPIRESTKHEPKPQWIWRRKPCLKKPCNWFQSQSSCWDWQFSSSVPPTLRRPPLMRLMCSRLRSGKAEQIDDLKQNWLPLAGLFWLKPGVNSFGTAPGNAVVFPKGPAHAGEFDLEGKDVTIKMLPDAHATLAGAPLTTAKLAPDVSGHASLVEMGTLRFHVIVRGERVGIRVKDLESASDHQLQRADILSSRSELPRDGHVGTLRWQEDDRRAQCSGRRDGGAGCGHSRVQDRWTGAETNCAGRRSIGRTVVRIQRSDGEERYLSRGTLSR